MSLFVNFIFTWSFLLPAYLIRFVFVKKPISKSKSFFISAVVYMIQALLSITIQESQNVQNSKVGPAVFLVAFISYKMLRSSYSPETEEMETNKNRIKVEKIQKTDGAGEKKHKNIYTFFKKLMSKKVIVIGIILLFIGFFINIYQKNEPSLALTDKNQENSIVIDNLYRNTKYNFRIKFPEGWNITDGDGPNVVQKAFKDNSSINILIKEFSSGVDPKLLINDIYSLEDIKEEATSTYGSDVKVLDSGETFLDNKPVLWVKYTATYSALDVKVEGTFTQYYLLYNKILYIITAGSTSDDFNKVESEFTKSILTFVIEDYQNENTVSNVSDENQNGFKTIKTFTKKSCGQQAEGDEIYTDWFKIDNDMWKIKISSERVSDEKLSNTRVWYTTSDDTIMDEISQKKESTYFEIGDGRPINENEFRNVEQEVVGPGKYRLRILCWNSNYSIEIQENSFQWNEYYLNQDKFKVSFPVKPSENNKSINVLGIEMPYVEYHSFGNGVDYYASYIDIEELYKKKFQIYKQSDEYENNKFIQQLTTETEGLDWPVLFDVYDVLFKNKSSIREIEKIKNHFYDHGDIDYLWKITGEDRFIKGKLIIVDGKDMYFLSAESDRDIFQEFEKFVYSWKPFGALSE